MAPDQTPSYRVAHLMTSLGVGGGGVPPAVRGLLRAERRLGIPSTAIGSSPSDGWNSEEVIELGGRPWPLPWLRGLRKAIDHALPDLLSVHGLWQEMSPAGRAWHRSTGRPVVIHPHGMLDPWALRNSRWKKRLAWTMFEGDCLKKASCLRALNTVEERSIRALGLDCPIAVIPNGIDLPSLDQACAPSPWTGSVIEGRRVLLFLGRIHPKKGLRNLLHGLRQARVMGNRDLCLAIAGWDDGGHLDSLRCLVEELKLTRDVLFLGPCFGARKESALRNAHGFVLPSQSEGLPLAVLEAWANALPVLMSSECNLAVGFSSAAAINCGTSGPDVAKALSIFAGMNRRDCMEMGRRGRHLAERDFNWDRISVHMLEVYRWLLGGGSRPGCVSQ